MEDFIEPIGSVYQYMKLMHEMLCESRTGITFDDVCWVSMPASWLRAYNNEQLDDDDMVTPPDDFLLRQYGKKKAWIMKVKSKFAKGKTLEKAKNELRRILHEHGTDFIEERNKKVCTFRYPDNLTFDPLEEYLQALPVNRQHKLQIIGKLLASSEGLFPDTWINNMSLQLLEFQNAQRVISFDHAELTNLEMIPELYQHILKREVISFCYHPFDRAPFLVTASPFYLKEYNLRWFLCATTLRDSQKCYSIYAVDRIEGDICCRPELEYLTLDTDVDELFRDIVGVTLPHDNKAQDIVLEILDKRAVGYLASKPLHPSQRLQDNILYLHVGVNYELTTRLLEFLNYVRIIKMPDSLRKNLEERIKKINENFYLN